MTHPPPSDEVAGRVPPNPAPQPVSESAPRVTGSLRSWGTWERIAKIGGPLILVLLVVVKAVIAYRWMTEPAPGTQELVFKDVSVVYGAIPTTVLEPDTARRSLLRLTGSATALAILPSPSGTKAGVSPSGASGAGVQAGAMADQEPPQREFDTANALSFGSKDPAVPLGVSSLTFRNQNCRRLWVLGRPEARVLRFDVRGSSDAVANSDCQFAMDLALGGESNPELSFNDSSHHRLEPTVESSSMVSWSTSGTVSVELRNGPEELLSRSSRAAIESLGGELAEAARRIAGQERRACSAEKGDVVFLDKAQWTIDSLTLRGQRLVVSAKPRTPPGLTKCARSLESRGRDHCFEARADACSFDWSEFFRRFKDLSSLTG